MKTPLERYNNDNQFRHLVDAMIHEIMKGHFTPSEIREAAILGSVIYHQRFTEGKMTIEHIKIADWLTGREREKED